MKNKKNLFIVVICFVVTLLNFYLTTTVPNVLEKIDVFDNTFDLKIPMKEIRYNHVLSKDDKAFLNNVVFKHEDTILGLCDLVKTEYTVIEYSLNDEFVRFNNNSDIYSLYLIDKEYDKNTIVELDNLLEIYIPINDFNVLLICDKNNKDNAFDLLKCLFISTKEKITNLVFDCQLDIDENSNVLFKDGYFYFQKDNVKTFIFNEVYDNDRFVYAYKNDDNFNRYGFKTAGILKESDNEDFVIHIISSDKNSVIIYDVFE